MDVQKVAIVQCFKPL